MKPQKSGLKSPKKNAGVDEYLVFDQIDGSHSYKDAVTDGYVEYQVRTRDGGSVFFFNFELAKKMGLIPESHPNELTAKLKEKILEIENRSKEGTNLSTLKETIDQFRKNCLEVINSLSSELLP